MADELKVSTGLVYTPPGISENITRSTLIDISAGRVAKATQLVGTSEESFNLVDVASARYFEIQNLDATNFVSVDCNSGAPYCIKLFPGDIATFPPGTNALYMKADTAACLVAVTAVNA